MSAALEDTMPAPPPAGCAWIKHCSCGRAYDRVGFLLAPLPPAGGSGCGLVWRTCRTCESTIAVAEEQLAEDAA